MNRTAARRRRAGPPGPPSPGRRPARTERGQSAVELALVLPVVVVLLLALVQVAVVVRDQILVVHAAREGAREAAVDAAPDAARRSALASSDLDPARLQVGVSGRGAAGSRVTVTTRYGPPTALPLVGAAVAHLELRATATMRVER